MLVWYHEGVAPADGWSAGDGSSGSGKKDIKSHEMELLMLALSPLFDGMGTLGETQAVRPI